MRIERQSEQFPHRTAAHNASISSEREAATEAHGAGDKYGPGVQMGDYAGQDLPQSTVDHLEGLDQQLQDADGQVTGTQACDQCGKDTGWRFNAQSGAMNCEGCGQDWMDMHSRQNPGYMASRAAGRKFYRQPGGLFTGPDGDSFTEDDLRDLFPGIADRQSVDWGEIGGDLRENVGSKRAGRREFSDHIRTSDGYNFYRQPDGRFTDHPDGDPDLTDMSFTEDELRQSIDWEEIEVENVDPKQAGRSAARPPVADHAFKPYSDDPERCVAELSDSGDTCNQLVEKHQMVPGEVLRDLRARGVFGSRRQAGEGCQECPDCDGEGCPTCSDDKTARRVVASAEAWQELTRRGEDFAAEVSRNQSRREEDAAADRRRQKWLKEHGAGDVASGQGFGEGAPVKVDKEAAMLVAELYSEDGDWRCDCGNTADGDGFYPSLEDGTEVEPVEGGPWQGHYVCGACGKVVAQIREARRRSAGEDCRDCGGDGCDWDTYPNKDGVAELCSTCEGTGGKTARRGRRPFDRAGAAGDAPTPRTGMPEDEGWDETWIVPQSAMEKGGPADWTWADEFDETASNSARNIRKKFPLGLVPDPADPTRKIPNTDPNRTEGVYLPPVIPRNPKLVKWEREQKKLRQERMKDYDPDPDGLQGRASTWDPQTQPLGPYTRIRLRVPPTRNNPRWHIEVGQVRKVNPDGTGYIKSQLGFDKKRVNFKPENILDVMP